MGSSFLFAMPSFLCGVSRLLDLGGTFNSYNQGVTPEDADTVATCADWLVVGNDLQLSISKISTEITENATEKIEAEKA